MCNLYAVTSNQQAIRDLFRNVPAAQAGCRDLSGNLGPLHGIDPDYLAPIVRAGNTGLERRWRGGHVKMRCAYNALCRTVRLRL